jgi:hypothetical protein
LDCFAFLVFSAFLVSALFSIINENGYRKFEMETVIQLCERCFRHFPETEEIEIIPNELKEFDELFI